MITEALCAILSFAAAAGLCAYLLRRATSPVSPLRPDSAYLRDVRIAELEHSLGIVAAGGHDRDRPCPACSMLRKLRRARVLDKRQAYVVGYGTERERWGTFPATTKGSEHDGQDTDGKDQ